MSFIKLSTFLPQAFDRIDRTHVVREELEVKDIETICKEALFIGDNDKINFKYKQETIYIYSASSVLKQKVHISRSKILAKLKQKNPQIIIRDIIFKGPQS